MQYIRRRIQRVSGVTIRDERVESQEFPVPSWRDNRDDVGSDRREPGAAQQDARSFKRQGTGYREPN